MKQKSIIQTPLEPMNMNIVPDFNLKMLKCVTYKEIVGLL